MPVNESTKTPPAGLVVRVIATTNGEAPDRVHYGYVNTWLGPCSTAFTDRGLCWLSPGDDNGLPDGLTRYLPDSEFVRNDIDMQRMLNDMLSGEVKVQVQLFGTEFQVRVWQALTEIPCGTRLSYGELARQLGDVKLARAVGSAVGRNPVAWLVPCHRVVAADGGLGGYRWGSRLKHVLLEAEVCGLS